MRGIEEAIVNGPVVTDGAWGTELQRRGLPLGDCPDVWNLTQPQHVEEVARHYVEAGSQVILTNTFGANRIALSRHGLADKTEEINRVGLRISQQAAAGRAHVFASIGPTGWRMGGSAVTEADMYAAFREQADTLMQSGAEALVIETMTELTEARLALAASRETGLPVVVCLVFGIGDAPDGTLDGATPEQAAEMLTDAGADAIGMNCGNGAASMLPVCRRLRAATKLPLWIKPNAGLPYIVTGRAVYTQPEASFAQEALRLIEAGADFIGGCCGTTPASIRSLKQAVEANHSRFSSNAYRRSL